MLRTFCLTAVLLTPMVEDNSAARMDVIDAGASVGAPIDQPAFIATEAIFVRSEPNLTNRFGLRFEAQTIAGMNVTSNFELTREALVTRNGQPARLFDVRTGDRVLIYHATELDPFVVRLEAVSRR